MNAAYPARPAPAAAGYANVNGAVASTAGGVGGARSAYKGTLPPGTKVAIGNLTVTVNRYLSEGGFAHVYLVTSAQPIPIPISGESAGVGGQPKTKLETLHVLKRMAVPDKETLATVRSEVEAHVSFALLLPSIGCRITH